MSTLELSSRLAPPPSIRAATLLARLAPPPSMARSRGRAPRSRGSRRPPHPMAALRTRLPAKLQALSCPVPVRAGEEGRPWPPCHGAPPRLLAAPAARRDGGLAAPSRRPHREAREQGPRRVRTDAAPSSAASVHGEPCGRGRAPPSRDGERPPPWPHGEARPRADGAGEGVARAAAPVRRSRRPCAAEMRRPPPGDRATPHDGRPAPSPPSRRGERGEGGRAEDGAAPSSVGPPRSRARRRPRA